MRHDGAVPILMYHAVADAPRRAVYGLSVAPDAFAEQMRFLAEGGFTPLTASALATAWRNGRPLPRRPVLITFDDGYEGVHRHCLPVLAESGFPATLFVSTGWLPGPYEVGGAAPDTMLDWDQVRELAAGGVEIGGHSHTHPQLDLLTDERLWSEVLRCREIIHDELDGVAGGGRRRRSRIPTAIRAAGCAGPSGRPVSVCRWRWATRWRHGGRGRTRWSG